VPDYKTTDRRLSLKMPRDAELRVEEFTKLL
jgi:hypothetical protein